MIAKDSLANLIAEGKAKGYLDSQDLLRTLPVGTMSAEEIALVVVEIEDAGVHVELDERLLAGRSANPRPIEGLELAPPRGEQRGSAVEPHPLATLDSSGVPRESADRHTPATRGESHAAVIVGGIVAAAVILALLAIVVR